MAVLPGPRGKDVDGGWAWLVLLASFLNLLVASGVGFVSGIFQKLFLEQFGQSVAFTAWVTALFSSFMQLAGPLSGALTSVTNCRVTVMAGGGVLTVGLAASAFAPSLHWLLLTFGLLAGIGLGLMYSPSIVIVNFFFHRRRTVIMGLALSAAGIGITFAPVLSRFLIDHFSWRETMLILAAITAHCCVFGAVMFPMHEPPSPCLRRCRRLLESGHLDPDPRGDGHAPSHPVPWADRHPGLPADQHSLSSPYKDVRTSRYSLLKEGACSDGFNPGDGTNELSSIPRRKEEDVVVDELKADTDHSAETCQLLAKKTQDADGTDCPHSEQMPGCGDQNLTESPQLSEGTRHIPEHDAGAVGQPQPHFRSGQSLKAQTHQESARPSPHPPQRLSHSAHDLHRLPGHGDHHHPHRHSLGGSVARIRGAGTARGSQLDLRTLSIFSSIHSLHSGGLPATADLVTSSPDLDREGGGGGDGLRVLLNVPFLFLCLNLFLSNMACAIFNIHLPAFAQQRGLDDQDITLVLAMDGVALFLARILLGALGHDDRVDKLAVYFGMHLVASLVQTLIPWTHNLAGVTAMASLMGIYYGSVYSLLTTLTISILGLPSLAFAFGVEMVCAGLGYLLAPPLAGLVVDVTGDYNHSMYLGGFLMFLSALSLLCLTCFRPPGAPPIGYNPPPSSSSSSTDSEVQTPPGQQDVEGR